MIRFSYILILLLGLFALSCERDQLTVEYVVSGKSSSAYTITFVSNAAGETSAIINASLPWNYAFTADRGDTVYISAWSSDSVKVQIFVDGDLKAEDWDDNVAEARCVVE
ncbi:MAG: MmpS family transport accessory protein [bacterium]|nr:MmpS family transport accessory protein [bacterium]